MARAEIFFFFQAEDGIRDGTVTGVHACALPIYVLAICRQIDHLLTGRVPCAQTCVLASISGPDTRGRKRNGRSEERRVGKEGGSWRGEYREETREKQDDEVV